MFYVLRNRHTSELLAEGNRRTNNLQKAKLFKLVLELDYLLLPECKTLTGEIICQPEGDKPPAGLEGEWDIVLVDIRLA